MRSQQRGNGEILSDLRHPTSSCASNNAPSLLLLLIIGLAISWIPFIGAIGGLVALIGALLVILGREAFGREHARNAILALIVFFVGIGVTIVGFVVLFFAAFSYRAGPGTLVQPSFAWLGVITIIGGGVTGISEVLLTYALQLSNGRILLWTAYAASIAISIANFLFILPFFSGTGFVFPAIFLTSFLGIIPALLYAGKTAHRQARNPLTHHTAAIHGSVRWHTSNQWQWITEATR